MLIADLKILSPDDPVSTRIWSMVWQFEVPGTQSKIEVKGTLGTGSIGSPPSTAIGCTFCRPGAVRMITRGAVWLEFVVEVAVRVTMVFSAMLAGAA